MEELLQWVGLFARIVVGGVLLYAGVQKLRGVERFVSTLRSYAWLPEWSRQPLAKGLPVVEAALGGVLLVGAYIPAAAALAAGLFVLFAALIGLTFRFRAEADCGCFGGGSPSGSARILARNLSLAVLAATAGVAAVTEPGAAPMLALAASASLAALAVSLRRGAPGRSDQSSVDSPQRRRFLRLAGGALGGLTLAAVLGVLRRAPAAEAACLGCGTCGTDYIFLYCTGPCCGVYIVKKWNNCQTYCYQCSSSSRIFCGVPACC